MSSKSYRIAAIGESGFMFYEWGQCSDNFGNLLICLNILDDPGQIPVYKLSIRQPLRIRVILNVQNIASYVSESYQSPELFHELWPCRMNEESFKRKLGQYMEDSSK
jgi:hypothetical protein